MAARFWVVQVGINAYRHHSDLGGCVNDVALLRSVLVDRFGAEPTDFVTVLDGDATREGILAALTRHFVDNAAIGPDDEVVFHYSGHGVLVSDPTAATPSGAVECLLPHDAGDGDALPIPDYTLDALFSVVAARRSKRITAIFDCCHSGGAMRQVAGTITGVRHIPPMTRGLPPEVDLEIRDAGAAVRPASGPTPWTLMAACRNSERAREMTVPGSAMKTHGVFSWYLADALSNMVSGTTYGMLSDLVSTRVSGRERFQQPQCEGRRDRAVFGGQARPRDVLPRVIGLDDDEIVLGAGALHDVYVGDTFEFVTPAALADPDGPAEVLGAGRAVNVTPTRSQLAVEGVRNGTDLLGARARRTIGGPRQSQLTVASDALYEVPRWHHAVAGSDWLRFPKAGETADLRVEQDEEGLHIVSQAGEPLVMPFDPRRSVTLDHIIGNLETITRYRRFCDLRNADRRSGLQGQFSVALRLFDAARHVDEMTLITPGPDGLTVEYRAHQPCRVIIDIVNGGRRPMFPHVFLCNPDYSIRMLYPRESGAISVPRGKTLHVGLRTPSERLEFYLPGDEPGESVWNVARDRIVVIANSKATDLSALEQGPLQVPRMRDGFGLDAMLEQLLRGTRHARPQRRRGEDWGVTGVPVTVVRAGTTLGAPQ